MEHSNITEYQNALYYSMDSSIRLARCHKNCLRIVWFPKLIFYMHYNKNRSTFSSDYSKRIASFL